MFKKLFGAGAGANVDVAEPQLEERSLPIIPQITTLDDLNLAVKIYGDMCRSNIATKDAKAREINAINVKYHREIVDGDEAVRAMYEKIEAFVVQNPNIRNGEAKVQLPTGQLFWRKMPASVQFAKGLTEADVVKKLKAVRLLRFIRSTESVDKMAIKKNEKAIDGLDFVSIEASEKMEIISF